MEHPLISQALTLDKESPITTYVDPSSLIAEGFTERLTKRILAANPEIFDNVNYLMDAPVSLVCNQIVTAQTTKFPVTIDYKSIPDLSAASAVEEELVNILVQELSVHLTNLDADLKCKGQRMCPYQLVVPNKSGNLLLNLTFATRYGVYETSQEDVG